MVPKPTPQEVADDDKLYVSPTSDDTLRERYEKVKALEAEMTDEEILALLRQPALFEDES